MPRNSESEEPLFDPFCNWWEGPHRQAIIDSYLEGLMFPDLADADESNADKCVVGLSVMAPQGVMWQFIRDVVERLPDRDDARRLFTAGPVESFFWRYGDNWIDEIEELGRTSLKFRPSTLVGSPPFHVGKALVSHSIGSRSQWVSQLAWNHLAIITSTQRPLPKHSMSLAISRALMCTETQQAQQLHRNHDECQHKRLDRPSRAISSLLYLPTVHSSNHRRQWQCDDEG